MAKAESGSLQGQSLVSVQAAGIRYAVEAHKALTGGRANAMKTLKTTLTKGQVPADQVSAAEAAIAEFGTTMDKLLAFKQKAGDWVMDSVASQVNELRALVAQADETMAKLRSLGQAIKADTAAVRADRSKQKRKEQQELAGKARLFTDRALPGCVLRFMSGLDLVEPLSAATHPRLYISNRTEHVQAVSVASLAQFSWWRTDTAQGLVSTLRGARRSAYAACTVHTCASGSAARPVCFEVTAWTRRARHAERCVSVCICQHPCARSPRLRARSSVSQETGRRWPSWSTRWAT